MEGDVFQGAEAHNCGFMAALAAIADHEDGYLVRLLLQQNEHEHDNDLNAEGCYRVSLFLNTSSRNLEKYRQVHPSLIASEQEVFFSNTRNSIKAATRGSWRTVVVDDVVPADCTVRDGHERVDRMDLCGLASSKRPLPRLVVAMRRWILWISQMLW